MFIPISKLWLCGIRGTQDLSKDNGEEIKDLIDDKAKLVLPKADTGMQNIKDYRKSCVII